MRALPLLFQQTLQLLEMLELPRLDLLRGEVGALVRDQQAGGLEAVRRQEAPREERVDRAVEAEGVRRHEAYDLVAEHVRVAQATQDAAGDPGAELSVVATMRVGLRLPEVVEQRREANRE